jgi:hypothetical protein
MQTQKRKSRKKTVQGEGGLVFHTWDSPSLVSKDSTRNWRAGWTTSHLATCQHRAKATSQTATGCFQLRTQRTYLQRALLWRQCCNILGVVWPDTCCGGVVWPNTCGGVVWPDTCRGGVVWPNTCRWCGVA